MIIRDGILKAISGALMVKGRRRNKLYYYNDSTMTRLMAIVSNNDADSKINNLWHRRLRHACEKGAKTCTLEFYEHYVLIKERRE